MNPEEYAVMARVEADHWWYRGLRDAVVRTLERLGLPEHPHILDAGCGTGETLRFLQETYQPRYLGGFDLSPGALAFARQKAPDADVYASDLCRPEVHRKELDLILCLDVIYIPGAARARDGLRRLVEHLRPGGLLLLNLPAYEWMRSEHDLAVHTSERYTRARVEVLLRDVGVEVELSTYRLCTLLPVVLAARLASMWRARGRDPASARSDLHWVPGPVVSALLFDALRGENALLARGISLPWGSSVLGAGRRP